MSPIRFPMRWPEPTPRRPSAGPWRSHDTDEGLWVVDIPDDGEITVTRLYFGDMETNTGRDISNADLVAAAPDLLAALVGVGPLLSDCRCGQPADCATCAVLRARRAAVSKATGGEA